MSFQVDEPTTLQFLLDELPRYPLKRIWFEQDESDVDEWAVQEEVKRLKEYIMSWHYNKHQHFVYSGVRTPQLSTLFEVTVTDSEGHTFALPNTTPSSGLSWGYNGTGPRALAHAVISHLMGETPNEYDYYRDLTVASKACWDLRRDVIAKLCDKNEQPLTEWRMTSGPLEIWLMRWIDTHEEEIDTLAERQVYFLDAYATHRIQTTKEK